MAKRQTYTINEVTFNTKKELEEYIKKILHGFPLDEKLPDSDTEFLISLLQRHPEVESKMGSGVVYITIQNDSRYGTTKHFQLHRADNSTTDFSYIQCIKPSTNLQKFKQAARNAIKESIVIFRDDYFNQHVENAICELTHQPITKNRCHVDHIPPLTFEKIVNDYINDRGINIDIIEFIGAKEDNAISNEFIDESLKEDFQKYHDSVAKLRVLSAWGNLSISKKK
jgi:hypothetical protein